MKKSTFIGACFLAVAVLAFLACLPSIQKAANRKAEAEEFRAAYWDCRADGLGDECLNLYK